MKEFKEQVLSKVKSLLMDTEGVLAHPVNLYKKDHYYNISVYNVEEDSLLFSVYIRKYEKYITENKSEDSLEIEISVNDVGSYQFSLSQEEYTEVTYLFNNLYEAAQPKFLNGLKI